MSIYDYFHTNFATIICSLGLIIILVFNRGAEKKIKNYMFLSAIVVFLLSIADYVDVGVSYNMELLNVRMAASVLGYILRPIPLYLMLLCVSHSKININLLSLPLLISIVLLMVNPFIEVVFSFNELGGFIRGPLGYLPHAVGLIYMLLVGYSALRMFYDNYINEGIILLFMGLIATASVIMETISDEKIFVSTAYAVFNILYYMFIHVQIVSKDQLTGLLNRASFYEDCSRYRDNIAGVISVDMNELKWINDNYGHAEGDKAIVSVSGCIGKVFGRKYPIYRMGGDEFIIVIRSGRDEKIDEKIDLCRKLLDEQDCSCAFGSAYCDKGCDSEADINRLLKEADDEMYADKKRIKEEAKADNRTIHMRK